MGWQSLAGPSLGQGNLDGLQVRDREINADERNAAESWGGWLYYCAVHRCGKS